MAYSAGQTGIRIILALLASPRRTEDGHYDKKKREPPEIDALPIYAEVNVEESVRKAIPQVRPESFDEEALHLE